MARINCLYIIMAFLLLSAIVQSAENDENDENFQQQHPRIQALMLKSNKGKVSKNGEQKKIILKFYKILRQIFIKKRNFHKYIRIEHWVGL